MDYAVVDIETTRRGIDAPVACCGVWLEAEGQLKLFKEEELELCVEVLNRVALLVGFNLLQFDVPILQAQTRKGLEALQAFDLFAAIRSYTGHRVSLAGVARATLGRERGGTGAESLRRWRAGDSTWVQDHCLEDVTITRDLFRFAVENGHLLIGQPPKRVPMEIPR